MEASLRHSPCPLAIHLLACTLLGGSLVQGQIMMKAVGLMEATGGTDLLREFDCPIPEPGPRDLLVRVAASGMNPIDIKVRSGRGNPGPISEPKILGFDGAGIVEAVGANASLFKRGDKVYFVGSVIRNGSNAELVVIDERLVGRAPTVLALTLASALPLTVITAWEGLFERAGIEIGSYNNTEKRLLMLPGAGGVGSMAIQLAKKLTGLYVIGTASRPESAEAVRSLGADLIINHRQPLKPQLEAAGLGGTNSIDYIFNGHDISANIADYIEIVRPFGKIIEIVPLPKVELPLLELSMKSVAYLPGSMFSRAIYGVEMERQGEILKKIAQLVESGQVVVPQIIVFPWSLESLRNAHAMQETGNMIGKLVLTREQFVTPESSGTSEL